MYKRGKNVLKINNRVSAKFIPVNFEFFHQTCLLGTNTLINFFDFFPPDMLIWVDMFIRHSRVLYTMMYPNTGWSMG